MNDTIINLDNLKQECCICLETDSNWVTLNCCNNNIHQTCLLLLFLNSFNKCPLCIRNLENIDFYFDRKTVRKLYTKLNCEGEYKERFEFILDNYYYLNFNYHLCLFVLIIIITLFLLFLIII